MAARAECSPSKFKSARRRVDGKPPEEELDGTISRLPVELIERILRCLPLREAVRTSILSRRWRYMWTNLTQLVFDKSCTDHPLPAASRRQHESINDRKMKIMDNVLVLHRAPIIKFELCHENLLSDREFDTRVVHQWVLYLTRMPITDFILGFPAPYQRWHDIPEYLFHCHNLVNLVLRCSLLDLPRMFRGFQNLKTLELFDVDMSQDSLEKLISSCPQLSKLDLKLDEVDHINHLNVDAPNLRDIDIIGPFEDISFGCNSLTSVKINFSWWDEPRDECPSKLQKFIACVPLIRHLEIRDDALKKYLSIGMVPGLLYNPILHLEYLFIDIDFCCPRDVLTTICLLRSSPNLKQIELSDVLQKFIDEDDMDAFSKIYSSSYSLEALRSVSVKHRFGTGLPEVAFLKFVLLNSPMLEEMQVIVRDESIVDELSEELERFQRASAQVKIVVTDIDTVVRMEYACLEKRGSLH